jgi:molybdopterin-containing oxidoreductase family membrane subunit
MVPDLATLRDRARSRAAWLVYGVLALGWRGSAEHWHHYERLYLLLAGLATPLVVSVHTIVSFDFAVGIVPGWHSTIYPPYFVAGAVFSGFAMVLTLAIPIRWAYGLEDFITTRHLENMGKILLATGLMVTYSYLAEIYFAWYGDSTYETATHLDRATGAYAVMYWTLVVCNVGAPQLMWSKRLRRSTWALFAVALAVNVGMWTERYVIVVQSLHRDYLPSSWGMYSGTIWDYATLAGTLGLFLALMFLFIRFLPAISIAEMRELVARPERASRPE